MRRSPTRREFLGTLGAGSLAPASVGNVSLDNATDPLRSHPFAPEPSVEWSRELTDGRVQPLELADGRLYVRTLRSIRALSPDGSERWRVETGDGQPDVVVGPDSAYPELDSTLYVTGDETVRSLDPDDGDTGWRYDTEEWTSIWGVTPELVLVRDGGVTALSRADGAVRWRYDFDGHAWLRPQYRDGRLYVGTSEAELHALDARDGSVRWRVDRSTGEGIETETPSLLVAAVADGRVLAWNEDDGTATAFDTADGTERWQFRTDEAPTGFPGTAADGTVYLNDSGTIRALDAGDGRERWYADLGAESEWKPTLLGKGVYVGTEDGLVAFDPDGRERWRVDDGTLAPLELVDGALVTATPDGTMYGLGVDDGAVRWRFELPGDLGWIPVASEGRVYVGTDSGRMVALSDPGPTPVYDAYRAATSTAGLAVGGLLGGALAVGAYRYRNRDDADSASDPALPSEPPVFEDYELLGTLAETEVAEVHRARAPGGTEVAVERVADALDRDAFAEALVTWADLDHEGVLDVRAWDADPVPWVATELPDATLADRAGDLTPRELARAVADAAETVHRAHREGVVHGRLAPESVWLAGGEVRVGDWELAAELRGEFDESDTDRLAAMVRDLLADEHVTENVDEVLSRALADDPADRYDSALKFADALRWVARTEK
ncbi:PQQ-binding-like beta-propeller repeat protein [Halorussus salilacus]|uniref:outer membrane protein assembly factor BamB family protein n=1 Tax=Halorussus salilacus TaxID=2953750 RepID=UPI00209F808B|nr:PQQ-binding-like beta-propeller repeat protein [Halorussus salilacus]USZ66921.1 PQQ-binding-like beta-propeller repeat protein [Halorussus salilacus]